MTSCRWSAAADRPAASPGSASPLLLPESTRRSGRHRGRERVVQIPLGRLRLIFPIPHGHRAYSGFLQRQSGALPNLAARSDPSLRTREDRRDPELAAWQSLLRRYRSRARQILAMGTHVTRQAVSLEEAVQWRREAESYRLRDSEFARTFWSDEIFVALQHSRPSSFRECLQTCCILLWRHRGSRRSINLSSVTTAFRSAEERSQCDLTDLLRQNVEWIVTRHAGRHGAAPAQ